MRVFIGVALLSLVVSAGIAGQAAAAYPEKPIKIILGYTPGGTTDAATRVIAQELSSQMGVPVTVENRPGAAGQIGLDATIRSAPDGYTLQFLTAPTMIALQLAGKSVNVDRDLTALSLVFKQGIFIATTTAAPGWDGVRDFAGVVAKAKAAPGSLNFGTIGTGSTGHLMGELLKSIVGVNWVHVPYKGQEPMMSALAAGEIQFVIGATTNNDLGGRVRLIAATGAAREKAFPNLPVLAETYPAAVAESWGGMTAPGGLPPDITRRLIAELKTAQGKPAVVEKLGRIFSTLNTMSGDEYQKFMRSHYEQWGKVIRDNNIKAE